MQPQLLYYQERLPKYAAMRMAFEVLTLATSLAATVLAFLDLASWTPIAVALSTSIAAYSKFSATDKKLQRFSQY